MSFVWFLSILAPFNCYNRGLFHFWDSWHYIYTTPQESWDSSRDTCAVTQYAYYPLSPLAEVSSSHRCYALHSCLHRCTPPYTLFINGGRAERPGFEHMKARLGRPAEPWSALRFVFYWSVLAVKTVTTRRYLKLLSFEKLGKRFP